MDLHSFFLCNPRNPRLKVIVYAILFLDAKQLNFENQS